MDDIEEQILSYPHLSAEEQREVEAYVEAHPEWTSLLQDVRAFEGVANEMKHTLPSDALLASYVVVQHVHPEEIPSTLQSAFSRLEARLEEDESLRRQVEAAHQRLKEAEAAVDPVSHFEQLTGRSLEKEEASASAPAEAASSGEAVREQEARSSRSLLEVFLGLPELARATAVVVVLLVGVYGGLYAVSLASQSTLDRLAAVEVSDQVVDAYYDTNTRSITPEVEPSSVDALYLEALSAVRSARTSTLGLFPRYDADELDRAEELLNQVLAEVEPTSFLALEAHFYLGKVALAKDEVETARSHFKTVVEREGRKTAEAYEILRTLQEEYPLGET